MPIHNGTQVDAGVFHDFHLSWVVAIQRSMKESVLSADHYAQVEQYAPEVDPASVDEAEWYVNRRRTLVVRHGDRDRAVASIEILSPGVKHGRAFQAFLKKSAEAIRRGHHLLVIDLFPPGPLDPDGIHGEIWSEIESDDYRQPDDEPLTLVAYSSGDGKTAYIEPTAVGRELIEMPLFLEPERYVNVPLEATYQAAYRGVPQRWKRVLEE